MNCIVYTVAYNEEKNISKAIESIIAQTYTDWVYYVVDNGSADATWEIIQDYAAKDSRIIPRQNKTNGVFEPDVHYNDILRQYSPDDYFCWLDADDEYLPQFLEKTMHFALENTLDVVMCGYYTVELDEFGQEQKKFVFAPSKTLVLRQDDFIGRSDDFGNYFYCMRSIWAKLYRVKTFLAINLP